jgi:hypothetical protein
MEGWNFSYGRVPLKLYNILEVKNALLKTLLCVTEYTIWGLVALNRYMGYKSSE